MSQVGGMRRRTRTFLFLFLKEGCVRFQTRSIHPAGLFLCPCCADALNHHPRMPVSRRCRICARFDYRTASSLLCPGRFASLGQRDLDITPRPRSKGLAIHVCCRPSSAPHRPLAPPSSSPPSPSLSLPPHTANFTVLPRTTRWCGVAIPRVAPPVAASLTLAARPTTACSASC